LNDGLPILSAVGSTAYRLIKPSTAFLTAGGQQGRWKTSWGACDWDGE